MRIARFAAGLALVLCAIAVPRLSAQDKPPSENKGPSVVLKLQVTISEQDGEKKVANLPYTFFLNSGQSPTSGWTPWTKVRMGSRVPAYVGKDGGLQYIDVGTNIDSRGFPTADGHFDISLNLERSWVEGDVVVPAEKPGATPGEFTSQQFKEPVIRQFKTELTVMMRDGQTIQSTQAADPLSGRVLTVTVTMTVVK